MSGWIKLHRSVKDHWLWEGEKFTKGQAWVDLLLWARHTPGSVRVKSSPMHLQAGQQARSEITLSKTWGWSRDKVRRFLRCLEDDGMIRQQKTHQTSIITICNYSNYQHGNTAENTSDNTATKQQPDTNQYTIEEGENGNKGKNKPIGASSDAPRLARGYSESFEQAWQRYPKRLGSNPKRGAYQAWNARIKEGYTEERMIEGMNRYTTFAKTNGIVGTERVMQAKRFFGPACEFEEEWQTTDCPHAEILEAWAEIMPDHIRKPSPEDWLPTSQGYRDLDLAWHQFKTMNRASTGRPVFEERDQGIEFYRLVFGKLARTDSVARENAAQFVTIGWAVKKENTVSIFKGDIQ